MEVVRKGVTAFTADQVMDTVPLRSFGFYPRRVDAVKKRDGEKLLVCATLTGMHERATT